MEFVKAETSETKYLQTIATTQVLETQSALLEGFIDYCRRAQMMRFADPETQAYFVRHYMEEERARLEIDRVHREAAELEAQVRLLNAQARLQSILQGRVDQPATSTARSCNVTDRDMNESGHTVPSDSLFPLQTYWLLSEFDKFTVLDSRKGAYSKSKSYPNQCFICVHSPFYTMDQSFTRIML